jgi:hypothetical protein
MWKAQGSGTTIVPLNSVAVVRLEMPPLLGSAFEWQLLFLALVSIVGAAARKVLPARMQPDRHRLWRAHGHGGGVFVLATGLWRAKWWSAVIRLSQQQDLQIDSIETSVRMDGSRLSCGWIEPKKGKDGGR